MKVLDARTGTFLLFSRFHPLAFGFIFLALFSVHFAWLIHNCLSCRRFCWQGLVWRQNESARCTHRYISSVFSISSTCVWFHLSCVVQRSLCLADSQLPFAPQILLARTCVATKSKRSMHAQVHFSLLLDFIRVRSISSRLRCSAFTVPG